MIDVSAAVPAHRLGAIAPLDLIDTSTYEFYRIAPPGAILASISIGLAGFDEDSARDAFATSISRCVRTLGQRSVSVAMLNGLPLILNLTPEQVASFRAECQAIGIIPTDGMQAAVEAIRTLRLKRVTVANKWDSDLNGLLRDELARAGIEIVGLATEVHTAGQVKGSYQSGAELAFALAEQAHAAAPDADGIYLAGGAWLTLGLLDAIERKFGKPVVTGQQSAHWFNLNIAGCYRPIQGHGELLSQRLDRSSI